MSKINWNNVDRAIFFAEFRFTNSELLAKAYVEESFLETPNETRLNTIWEIGQGCFSSLNNREQREQLFMNSVHKANGERVGA
jgi:hypothetical protein